MLITRTSWAAAWQDHTAHAYADAGRRRQDPVLHDETITIQHGDNIKGSWFMIVLPARCAVESINVRLGFGGRIIPLFPTPNMPLQATCAWIKQNNQPEHLRYEC